MKAAKVPRDTLTALRREVDGERSQAELMRRQRDEVISWLAKCEGELGRMTDKAAFLEREVGRLKAMTDRLCLQIRREQDEAHGQRKDDP